MGRRKEKPVSKEIQEFLEDIRGSKINDNTKTKIEEPKDLIKFYDDRLHPDMAAAREAGIPKDLISLYWESFTKMSKEHIGALLVFPKFVSIMFFSSTCTYLNVPVSANLLEDIFYPGTKLHDGAVVIRKGHIKLAAVFFTTMATKDYGVKYGARHRAALGITKATDASAIIVSEETGKIEFVRRGKITELHSKEEFEEYYRKYISKK